MLEDSLESVIKVPNWMPDKVAIKIGPLTLEKRLHSASKGVVTRPIDSPDEFDWVSTMISYPNQSSIGVSFQVNLVTVSLTQELEDPPYLELYEVPTVTGNVLRMYNAIDDFSSQKAKEQRLVNYMMPSQANHGHVAAVQRLIQRLQSDGWAFQMPLVEFMAAVKDIQSTNQKKGSAFNTVATEDVAELRESVKEGGWAFLVFARPKTERSTTRKAHP